MNSRDAEDWMPVPLWRGWARRWRLRRMVREETRSMRIRILCGAYDPSSPFIEGGCATDWVEELDGSGYALDCPGCGQHCPEEIVGCAREMLATRVVFIFGCSHRAFTFSRREREPYFCAQGDR